jgi:hypothetical protein
MKKKLLTGFTAGVGILGMAATASSIPITFTDTTQFTITGIDPAGDLVSYGQNGETEEIADAYLLKDENSNDYDDTLSWNHNFTSISPPASITSANLTITFGAFSDPNDNNSNQYEFANVLTEGSTGGVLSTEIDPSTAQTFNVVVSNLADGVYNVQISDASVSNGGFIISQSDLQITYEPIAAHAPETATMLLFGTGLIGLAGISMRRKKK